MGTNSSLPSLSIMEVTIHTSNIQKKKKSLIDSGSSLNLILKENAFTCSKRKKTSIKVMTLKGTIRERLRKATQLTHKITISVSKSRKTSKFTCSNSPIYC
jgi:hypothetical protein